MLIYVIQCTNNKYFVGASNMTEKAYFTHICESPNDWLKKYSPHKVINKYPAKFVNDEDLITIQTMKTYGLTNVRGGSFIDVKLTKTMVDIINKQIDGESLFSSNDFIKKYKKINKISKIFFENNSAKSSWDMAKMLIQIEKSFDVIISENLGEARLLILNKLLPKIGMYFIVYEKDLEAIYQNTLDKELFYIDLDWEKLLTKKQIRSLETIKINLLMESLNKLKDLNYFKNVHYDILLQKIDN